MKIKEQILEILKQDERLWDKDKEGFELNQTLLFELVENYDEKILQLLFKNIITKEKFFKKVQEAFIFNQKAFRFFLEEHKINNSFTDYKNKIGLSDGKRFLKDTNDIVLNFPFKDCVLEGGQSDEDGMDTYFEYDETITATQAKNGLKAQSYNEKSKKRKEIFYNEILAYDEIDRLYDKKALTNFKRFSGGGGVKLLQI